MEGPHRIYGVIVMTSIGSPVWTGWLNNALGAPVSKLCTAVASYFKTQNGNQNSCYLDASSFAAASTSDGDCIVTLVCSLAAPETEVLLKAREVSHAIKLLYGSEISNVLKAANIECIESGETTDLLQLLQATPSSTSLPASLRDWLSSRAKHEDLSRFITDKLSTLSPCTAAFTILEQTPGFICTHFIDVTEPGEVLLSHWPQTSDGGASHSSGKSSSGGGSTSTMNKIKQMGKGVMSALSRSQGGASSSSRGGHAAVSPAIIASMQQLMARHVSSLWTVIMREARTLAQMQSKQHASIVLGQETGTINICTVDLSALVPDTAATIQLVSLQHYEAAFVVVYRHERQGQSERRSTGSSKGTSGGAFQVTYGHGATSAGVVPFLEQACQDLKARFPITRQQLLRQVWPDMPGSVPGTAAHRMPALPARPSQNQVLAVGQQEPGKDGQPGTRSSKPPDQGTSKVQPAPSAAMKSVSSALGMRVAGIMQQSRPPLAPAAPAASVAQTNTVHAGSSGSPAQQGRAGSVAAGAATTAGAQEPQLNKSVTEFTSPWRIGTGAGKAGGTGGRNSANPDWLLHEDSSDLSDGALELPDLSVPRGKVSTKATKPSPGAKSRYKPVQALGEQGQAQATPPRQLAPAGGSAALGLPLVHTGQQQQNSKHRQRMEPEPRHSPEDKENAPQSRASPGELQANLGQGGVMKPALFPAQPPAVPRDQSVLAARPAGVHFSGQARVMTQHSGVVGVLGSQQQPLQSSLAPQPPIAHPGTVGSSPNVRRRSGDVPYGALPSIHHTGNPWDPYSRGHDFASPHHQHHLHHAGYGSHSDEWEQYQQYKSGRRYDTGKRFSGRRFRDYLDSPVHVASAWELLQASLTREEERKWRLHLMHENIALRNALGATGPVPANPYLLPPRDYPSTFSYSAQPRPPPPQVTVCETSSPSAQAAQDHSQQSAPYTTIHIHAGSPDAAPGSPPHATSSPPVQVLVSPPGPPHSAPYNIWQLFNGGWYRLTPAGLWVASAEPHALTSPVCTFPASPTKHIPTHVQATAAPSTAPPGTAPYTTAMSGAAVQPSRLAHDIATDLWSKLQYQVEAQVYSALTSFFSLQGITLPSPPAAQADSLLAALSRKQAAWDGGLQPARSAADAAASGVEFYMGGAGQLYCKLAGTWYEVNLSTA